MASRLQDVIQRGLAAARPLATAVAPGTLYYSTDTLITERSDGTTWESYADAGAGVVPLHATTHESGGTDLVDVKQLDGFPGGTTTFLRADATFAAPPAIVGGLLNFIFARKTGDESVSNSTLQNDDHLLFAVGASETWIFRIVVVYTALADSTNGKIKFAMTAPSGTIQWNVMGKDGAQTTNSGTFATNTGVASGTSVGNNGGAGATLMHAVIDGIIINGVTPGNCVLQWAQNLTNATATVVKTNSYLTAMRVA